MTQIFGTVCKFCGARGYPPSLAGLDICGERCYPAISIIGSPPVGLTWEDYTKIILNIGSLIVEIPQQPGEKLENYKVRLIMAHGAVKRGDPIPPALMKPLSDAVLKMYRNGGALSHMLLVASQPPKPTVPDVKKVSEVHKARIERAAREERAKVDTTALFRSVSRT